MTGHPRIFQDNEWLRLVFPLLTHRELRVLTVLDDLGPRRPTSSAEIAEKLGLDARNVRQVLLFLQGTQVVSRPERRQRGTYRISISPDAIGAEKALRSFGRTPAGQVTSVPTSAQLGSRTSNHPGSSDRRIVGSPTTWRSDLRPFSPIDRDRPRAPVGSQIREGGMENCNLPSFEREGGGEGGQARPSAVGVGGGERRQASATPPAPAVASLALERAVLVGRELWPAWSRRAQLGYLEPLLEVEASDGELEAFLRAAAQWPDMATVACPPWKAGENPQRLRAWLVDHRRSARSAKLLKAPPAPRGETPPATVVHAPRDLTAQLEALTRDGGALKRAVPVRVSTPAAPPVEIGPPEGDEAVPPDVAAVLAEFRALGVDPHGGKRAVVAGMAPLGGLFGSALLAAAAPRRR